MKLAIAAIGKPGRGPEATLADGFVEVAHRSLDAVASDSIVVRSN